MYRQLKKKLKTAISPALVLAKWWTFKSKSKFICSENVKYRYSEQWEQLMSRDNKAQKSTYS